MGLGIDFKVGPETQQLQRQLEGLLMQAAQQAEKAAHLTGKTIQLSVNLPLFALMQQWVGMLVGDVLRHLAEEGESVSSGLLPEDAEGLLAGLEEVDGLLGEVHEELGIEAGQKIAQARERLGELAEAIQQLTLEESDEDEEEEEDLEFVEDGKPEEDTVEVDD